MFGYTVPSYSRLSPADNSAYRRYYCEGCHQLRDGFGLTGALTVNYDMTFNTILLHGLSGEPVDFEGTTRRICVLERHKADSELMRRMAAYTLILTKWELYDDETDLPSTKTRLISTVLGRAIGKAASEFPEYDAMVGEGFSKLRSMELDGCRDAVLMGRTFGEGLVGPLEDIAGDSYSDDLGKLFVELSAAVYLMDAVDDLDEDYMDGTYNPLLPKSGYKNARSFVDANVYSIASMMNGVIGSLQRSYSIVRGSMKGNQSICDNIVYFGIPESAKKVMVGDTEKKASIKNVFSKRKDRLSERSGGIEVRADVQGVDELPRERAGAHHPSGAAPAASGTVPGASVVRIPGSRLGYANPQIAGMPAQPAGPASPVALVHGSPRCVPHPYRFLSSLRIPCDDAYSVR